MLIEEMSGKHVVVLDDIPSQVESLVHALEERQINTEFIKVDLAGDMPHHASISTVKLIFLDLHYGLQFDPAFCARLISDIVPRGHQYYLVAWTQDPDKTESVIEELREMDLAPIFYLSKLKDNYRTGVATYNIDKLLDELNNEFEQIVEMLDYPGRIIQVEEKEVLINCLIIEKPPAYQIRRFDKLPFENYIDLKPGNYVMIHSITKPGSRLFEFSNGHGDLAKYFHDKGDFFKSIDTSKLFDKE